MTTKSRLLSHATFIEVDAFYEQTLAGQGTYALVVFSTDTQFIMKTDQAIKVLDLFSFSTAAKQQSSNYRAHRFALPTLRILTSYEHRCQWIANYFDVSLSDIEEYCKPDSIRALVRQFKLDFTPPDHFTPPDAQAQCLLLDDDLNGG